MKTTRAAIFLGSAVVAGLLLNAFAASLFPGVRWAGAVAGGVVALVGLSMFLSSKLKR